MWTRVSVRHYDGTVVPATDPKGRPIFWFPAHLLVQRHAARSPRGGNGSLGGRAELISLTPLRLDLTDETTLQEARDRSPLEEILVEATRSSN